MKKIVPLLMIILLLIMPSVTTFAAETDHCKVLKTLFNGANIKQENGICKLEIPRTNLHVTNMGVKLSPEAIGLSFGVNFEKVGDTTAVVGEFALLGEEVNPVIDALRKGNIQVTALHNHQIGEQPQILYLHFQSTGDITSLATTVKNAIETTSNK